MIKCSMREKCHAHKGLVILRMTGHSEDGVGLGWPETGWGNSMHGQKMVCLSILSTEKEGMASILSA